MTNPSDEEQQANDALQTTRTNGPSALEQLALEAEGQMAPPAVDDGKPPAPTITNADRIKGALVVVRDVFSAFTGLQTPKQLTDTDADTLGAAWGAVADKHGIDLGAVAGDYGAEIAALMATLAVGARLVPLVRAEIAEKVAKEKADKGEQLQLETTTSTPAAPVPGPAVATFTAGVVPAWGGK